jgi:DcuC family C4-dicarboxylate transporter
LLTVKDKTGVDTREIVPFVLPLVLPVLAVSTLVLWVTIARTERRQGRERERPEDTPAPLADTSGADPEPLNLLKAVVPLVPLALLFLSGPPLSLFEVPLKWLATEETAKLATSRLIALAMLVGVGAAAAVAPRKAGGCMKAFFDGAGYGFTHVVSLIVVANCFGTGIKLVKLADHLGGLIAAEPALLQPLAGFVPCAFAWVSGSGMASTQSLYGFFHGPAVATGADPLAVGAMVSVGAAAGRTMSPVAAVVLMCGTLTGARPGELLKRVGPALLAGLTAAVALRALGVV